MSQETMAQPLIHREQSLCGECKERIHKDVPVAYCVHERVLLVARFDTAGKIFAYRTYGPISSAMQAESLIREGNYETTQLLALTQKR